VPAWHQHQLFTGDLALTYPPSLLAGTNRSFFDDEPLPNPHLAAASGVFAAGDSAARGAIFTRCEVVAFILDLAGYTVDQPLWTKRLLEPACGHGDFLAPVVDRLLTAYRTHHQQVDDQTLVADLREAVVGMDLHAPSLAATRTTLQEVLIVHQVGADAVRALLDAWLHQGDFLLQSFESTFTHVVGNPPYVRQEAIPDVLLAAYRARFSTMIERADLYVPFLEHSLGCLAPGGTLAVICSDRWMKNTYGARLRQLVAGAFHLAVYVDMVDTPAFTEEVVAYPAITVIRRAPPAATRIAHQPALDPQTLTALVTALQAPELPPASAVQEAPLLPPGSAPWLLQGSPTLPLIRRLEATLPTLEEAGCMVGIGVATGADRVFIAPYAELPVEDDRKLPLVKPQDLADGTVHWQGLGVVNPFNEDGTLADLAQYPRFAAYLQEHEVALRARHCARQNPRGWYRTIDRISPALTWMPKLLIPDIKGAAHIVYDAGQGYPHHNLYVITSTTWDLHALQAVLQAQMAHLFVSAYSTRMRGGYLRFQAQYLRRIRLPQWADVPADLQRALTAAGQQHDRVEGRRATFDLYQLTQVDQATLMAMTEEESLDA
jgi:hypothetical protein